MKHLALILLALILLTATASASPVQITVPCRDGSMDKGSGTYIADNPINNTSYVLTNWHVIRDNVGKFIVTDPTGDRYAAKLVYQDAQADIALLHVQHIRNVKPTPIAPNDAPEGAILQVWASSPAHNGQILCYNARSNRFNDLYNELDVPAVNGDSGSPVTYENMLVGIMWGVDNVTHKIQYTKHAVLAWHVDRYFQQAGLQRNVSLKQWSGCASGDCGQDYGWQPASQNQVVYQYGGQQGQATFQGNVPGTNIPKVQQFNTARVDYSSDIKTLTERVKTLEEVTNAHEKSINVMAKAANDNLDTLNGRIDQVQTSQIGLQATLQDRLKKANDAFDKQNTSLFANIQKANKDTIDHFTQISKENQEAQKEIIKEANKEANKTWQERLKTLDQYKTTLETKYQTINANYVLVKGTLEKLQESRGLFNTVTILKATGIPLTGCIGLVAVFYIGKTLYSRFKDRPKSQDQYIVKEYQRPAQRPTVEDYYEAGPSGAVYPKGYRPNYAQQPVGSSIGYQSTGYQEPIVVQQPPPPQVVRKEHEYYPVEVDSFQKAHDWARTQVAKKFPGSTETLDCLESLITQHMNAQHKK